MPFKFNPLTGQLDYYETSTGGGATLTKKEVIQSILLDKDETALPSQPLISIIFDEDSILINDDEAM